MEPLKVANCVDARLKNELSLSKDIKWGKSAEAFLLQELLRLQGISVVLDGDFGPATQAGLDKFGSRADIAITDIVNQATIDALAQPLLRAAALPKKTKTLNEAVVAVARQHLELHPIEIGGANAGPWVRLYMNGSQGRDYPWCAGFVTYVMRQAAKANGVSNPVTRTFSCDVIGMEAKAKNGKFIKRTSPSEAPAGSIFLVPHKSNEGDWVHTGFVVEPDVPGPGPVFRTIEGNTNDDGSREGFEVCERYRACGAVDIVLL